MTAPGLRHKPIRRTWVCGTCGEPWLCGEAKAELLEIFDAASPVLRGLLNFFMIEAVKDFIAFRRPKPRVMADRIYGWYAEIIFMAIDGERVASSVGRTDLPDVGSEIYLLTKDSL